MNHTTDTARGPRWTALIPALALAACSGFGANDEAGSSSGDNGADAGIDTSDTSGRDGGQTPEDEAFALTAPTASLNYVWIANTTRGTVAKVAVEGGAIRIETVRVGAEPTVIVTDDMDDVAVVLNSGSDTLSIVTAGTEGRPDLVRTVEIVPDCNRVSLSPDADYAFAWYDNRAAETGDRAGSLTEVSAIPIHSELQVAYQLSVGVNVRDVVYSDAGDVAYVLSDDGVSRVVLDQLDADRFVPPVAIAAEGEALGLSEGREILVADAAGIALVRIGDRSALRMIDLSGGATRDLELPAPPTDIDLVPGQPLAVIAMRDREELGILDLDGLRDGDIAPVTWLSIEGQPVGQTVLSPGGTEMLVFSSAADSERLTIVDIATREWTTYNLRKGIRGAVVSPDGLTAVVYHTKAPGEPVAGEPEADIIAKSHAYSVISLRTGLTKLVRTDAQPGEMTFDADGDNAFVLTVDVARNVRALEWIDLETFRTRHIDFVLPPEHVGVVPGAGLIYVSQIHELGRIAFVDIATGDVREVTGFELNGLID